MTYRPPNQRKYNPIERCCGVLENHGDGSLLDSIEVAVRFPNDDDLEGKLGSWRSPYPKPWLQDCGDNNVMNHGCRHDAERDDVVRNRRLANAFAEEMVCGGPKEAEHCWFGSEPKVSTPPTPGLPPTPSPIPTQM